MDAIPLPLPRLRTAGAKEPQQRVHQFHLVARAWQFAPPLQVRSRKAPQPLEILRERLPRCVSCLGLRVDALEVEPEPRRNPHSALELNRRVWGDRRLAANDLVNGFQRPIGPSREFRLAPAALL